ncbi:putative 5-methylthioadenosine s-adenosylhomocysteine deaminase n1 [Diaporthe ampelina]|uniref:Putative 5-methylthioadenosine s-adenosylhomocysteine deaminase n1 n=1 Tax=Diaporthe ampelina TaxID=1214573 RepID=A0A0G2FK61_9PEZI|nr:putative 5-methylthioadenosine s-adenosylhomocysteine deaminase n1 [Diaporthe ampelina]
MPTLYQHATIITVNEKREIILDGAILVVGNRIALIDKYSAVIAHPEFPQDQEVRTVDLAGKIIVPGLINTHCHTVQSLLRGLAEDLWLHPWIAGFDNVVRAVGESGIRACLGKLVKPQGDNTKTQVSDVRDRDLGQMSIEAALAAHKVHNGSFSDRVHIWMAASTPRGSPLSEHLAIGSACHEHGINLTMHCAEASRDRDIYRDCYEGRTPVQFCRDARLGGAKGSPHTTVLAHMVHLDAADLRLLARGRGVSVAHNPTSNCKLASGVAAVPDMLAAGVNVGLGTDGAPCNNTYDMFREMHMASALQAGTRMKADVLPATTVLEMATINGAKALGLDLDVGSLEQGKKADFAVLDVPLSAAPFEEAQIIEGGIDPVTVVVHSCTAADVEAVVVDGRMVVEKGKLLTMDEDEIIRNARAAIRGIRDRSGVKARPLAGWVIR